MQHAPACARSQTVKGRLLAMLSFRLVLARAPWCKPQSAVCMARIGKTSPTYAGAHTAGKYFIGGAGALGLAIILICVLALVVFVPPKNVCETGKRRLRTGVLGASSCFISCSMEPVTACPCTKNSFCSGPSRTRIRFGAPSLLIGFCLFAASASTSSFSLSLFLSRRILWQTTK